MKRTAEEIMRLLNNVNTGYTDLYHALARALAHRTLTVDLLFRVVQSTVRFWLICHPIEDEAFVNGTMLPRWLEALTPPELLPEMRRRIISTRLLPN